MIELIKGCLGRVTVLVFISCVLCIACERPISSNVERGVTQTRIMGFGEFSSEQMAAYVLLKNTAANREALLYLARTYIREAKLEGVNHDIAFAQMCHETYFLKFGNQVKKNQHNYCGLGATDGGGKGAVFKDVSTGVRAHIQHLKAYASTKSLKSEVIDPRFRFVERACAPTLAGLAGRWASDKRYAHKVLAHIQAIGQCSKRLK